MEEMKEKRMREHAMRLVVMGAATSADVVG